MADGVSLLLVAANNITQLVQRAALAYAQTAVIGGVPSDQIYKGLDSQALRLPRLVVCCQRAARELNFNGHWMAELRLIIRSQADDTDEETHHARAGECFDKFMTESIAEDMSAAMDGFTASMVIPREQSWDIDGDSEGRRSWRSELLLDVRCTGNDIPD